MIVLDGNPIIDAVEISNSKDLSSGFWSCTKGRFNYFYPDCDEVIVILEGKATLRDLRDPLEEYHSISAGSVWHFKRGDKFEWTIEDYVRKFWVIRSYRKSIVRRILKKLIRRN